MSETTANVPEEKAVPQALTREEVKVKVKAMYPNETLFITNSYKNNVESLYVFRILTYGETTDLDNVIMRTFDAYLAATGPENSTMTGDERWVAAMSYKMNLVTAMALVYPDYNLRLHDEESCRKAVNIVRALPPHVVTQYHAYLEQISNTSTQEEF